jgi:DNA-binding XRE family transcriptional regulator
VVDKLSTKSCGKENKMTDTVKLKMAIDKSGLKKTFIAETLGLSYQGYLKKENGINDFVSNEIKIMKDLLHLSDKEVIQIFLS